MAGAGEVWQTVKTEFAAGDLSTKLLLGSMVVGLAFEWATGNESLMGYVGAHVLNATHDSVDAGIATGLASFAEQSLLGLGMALNIKRFPETMAKVQQRISKSEAPDAEPRQQSLIRDLGSKATRGFLLGSALLTLRENSRQQKTLGENSRDDVITSGFIGTEVGLLIGGVATGLTELSERFGLESQTHFLISDVFSNPLTYLGIYGLVAGTKQAVKHFGNHGRHVREREKPFHKHSGKHRNAAIREAREASYSSRYFGA